MAEMTLGKKMGRSLGQSLGVDADKRNKRRQRQVASISKRPGSRGRYTGRERGGGVVQLERYAAQPAELGSLPERIWLKWLEDNGFEFSFQQTFGDIRFKAGGNLADFFLPTLGADGTVVSVVGVYWHLDTYQRDLEMYMRLTGQGQRVVSSYEFDIYEAALGGRFGSYARGLLFSGGQPPIKLGQQHLARTSQAL